MKFFKTGLLFVSLFLLAFVNNSGVNDSTGQLSVMSFNIRYNNPADGVNAWENRKQMVTEFINKIAGDTAVILTGDLNFTSESEGYKIIISKENKTELLDAMFISENPHFGGTSTFNGFGKTAVKRKIDFIFTGGGLKVKKHGIYEIMEQDVFISDHWPVYARIEWNIAL